MAKKRPRPALPSDEPRIHEAVREGDGSIRRARELTIEEAVELRQNGIDVVVCGGNVTSNRNLGRVIEEQANGRWEIHRPRESAGSGALPHFQPAARPPGGHTFYETSKRKAR